jgi:tetratricopeptide (TPR) repeat protein
VKSLTFVLSGLLLVSSLSGASESATERTLKGIVARQKILLAQAAETNDKLDEESLKVQLTQLTHEYQLLILTSPDFAEAYASYGYLLSKLGQNSEAMKQLLKADHLDPTIALVKNQLGNALAENGKPLEAINYFQAAEQLAPEELGYAYRYAESFYDLSHPDWDEAFHAWTVLESKAGSIIERQTMQLQEANVRLKQGRIDEARGIAERVSDPTLTKQKQKLVAQLAQTARK